jgi:hypothetical protein
MPTNLDDLLHCIIVSSWRWSATVKQDLAVWPPADVNMHATVRSAAQPDLACTVSATGTPPWV